MRYKVIKLFTDLQDGGHKYDVGDTYPREGLSPKDERIAELSGSGNKQGTPLIELIGDNIPDTEIAEGTAENNEEEKPKKRSRRKADEE